MLLAVRHNWCEEVERRTNLVPLMMFFNWAQSVVCERVRELRLGLGLRWNAVPEIDRTIAVLRVASENYPNVIAIDNVQRHDA